MFLFMAGEIAVSLNLALRTDNWHHTTRASKLFKNKDGTLHRECVNENIQGIFYHADVYDKSIEQHNINIIKETKIPCYPPISVIEPLINRFTVLSECYHLGLINHEVIILNEYNSELLLPCPYVLKANNIHRGENKYLINKKEDIPIWEGEASVEPFFNGESYRVLIVGDKEFVIKITNDESWIKNTIGGDTHVVSEPIYGLIHHARRVADLFHLELAGIDYIVTPNDFYLLEINIFCGLDYGEESKQEIEKFIKSKMNFVEQLSKDKKQR